MTSVARVPSAKQLVSDLIDRGFTRDVAPVIRALTNGTRSGVLGMRLSQFKAEAARLAATGEVLTLDNPVAAALLSAFEDFIRAYPALIQGGAYDLETAAINAANTLTRQLALPGVTDGMLGQIGVQWNTPDPAAVANVVDYTANPTWQNLLGDTSKELLDNAQDIIIRGVANGHNPRLIAEELGLAIQDLPAYRAEQIMRTLQLMSYRGATAAYQAANADIIDKVIRIETLDDRTCVECWALHGTELEVGEIPEEHPNGRAVGVAVVKGFSRSVEPGVVQFERLDDARKAAILGPAAFAAYQDGKVTLQDFVEHYTDPVFGGMIRAASLKGLLGDAAKQYYRNGPGGQTA